MTFTVVVGVSTATKFETYILDAPSMTAAIQIAQREGKRKWGNDVRAVEAVEISSKIIPAKAKGQS